MDKNITKILTACLTLVDTRISEAKADFENQLREINGKLSTIGATSLSESDRSLLSEQILSNVPIKTLPNDLVFESDIASLKKDLLKTIQEEDESIKDYIEDNFKVIAESIMKGKETLSEHDHNDKYSQFGHIHEQYANADEFKLHEHDEQYAPLNDHVVLKESISSLSDSFSDELSTLNKSLDAVEAANTQFTTNWSTVLENHVQGVSGRLDEAAGEVAKTNITVEGLKNNHDKLSNNFSTHVENQKSIHEKVKGQISDLKAAKANVDHKHDYAKPNHSHEEFSSFLQEKDLGGIKKKLDTIEETHGGKIDKVFKALESKLDSASALTKGDIEALKTDVTALVKSQIKAPKDAYEWDFKQHPNKQGTLMYKRSDWKQWKHMTIFNNNLLNEIMNTVNRNMQPQQGGGIGFAGPVYQDPKDIVSSRFLGDLRDVDMKTTAPSSNDLFMWDSLTSQWVPRTLQELTQLILPAIENDMLKQYNKLVDTIDATTMYVGEAVPGTATSAALWRIKKIVDNNGDMVISFADNSADFVHIWDNHLALSYTI